MLAFLLSLNVLRTATAILGVVGFRLKRLAADRASLCGVISEDFRFQRLPLLVLQQHMSEEFAVDGVGYALYTNTFFAVVQQDTVAIVIV